MPANLEYWVADPLVKVMPDTTIPTHTGGAVELDAVKGEVESGQVVLLATGSHAPNLQAEITELRLGGQSISTGVVHAVGYVPVRQNTPDTPQSELVHAAPAWFPDPLFASPFDMRKGEPQALWVTVSVPREAEPGIYSGELRVWGAGEQVNVPVRLRVHNVLMPTQQQLKVTNWFSLDNIVRYHGVEKFSEPFWNMIELYARNMAAYGQNMILTPLYDLIRFQTGPDNQLSLDFAFLDRFLGIFTRAGVVGYVEGGHLAGREGGWLSEHFAVSTRSVANNQVVTGFARAGTQEAESFLSQFLPQLQRYIDRRGLSGRYWQHIADEPIAENAASYSALVRLVRRYAPGMRIMEATHCASIEPIDLWVPQLDFYQRDREFYRKRQQLGDEVWFYTCLNPVGTFPNRFIDYSLLKVRLLHWLNYRFGATGFLHWGYNFWRGNQVFSDVEPVHGFERCLPPGDHCIVYPGQNGLVNSIRLEAMRDGIEDYELLTMLHAKDPDKAQAIAGRIVQACNQVNQSIAAFRDARRDLIGALET